jgi:hypothetical protein
VWLSVTFVSRGYDPEASRITAVHDALEELLKAKHAFSELAEPIRKRNRIVEDREKFTEKITPLPMHKHHAPPALGQNVNELVKAPTTLNAAYDA